jgi:hypothetical protein
MPLALEVGAVPSPLRMPAVASIGTLAYAMGLVR